MLAAIAAILKRFFHMIALLALYQSLFTVRAHQQCGGESSILGKMLRGHTFLRIKTNNGFECYVACHADQRCQSFNYVIYDDKCELNDRTKEARPEDFVSNRERYYMRRDTERGILFREGTSEQGAKK